MTDVSPELSGLAREAGLAPRWQDYKFHWHEVGADTLLAVLDALGLPARTPGQMADSRAVLEARRHDVPPLITARVGEPIPVSVEGAYRIHLEGGGRVDGVVADGRLAAVAEPGYHELEAGGRHTTLAVAPARGFTVQDAGTATRPWAIAVQLYALRRPGDGGLGDFRALEDLARAAARHGAAGIAISPVHAQFSADLHRFSPYSPSSRIQLNVLHSSLDLPPGHDGADLVDWPAASRLRLQALEQAFRTADAPTLAAFAAFRAAEAGPLEAHARFEALHAHLFAQDPTLWNWRNWPDALRDPKNPAVLAFAEQHADAVSLHAFMQFSADRSLAAAQAAAKDAGMPIGLIADLAVGTDSGGSHCWTRQDEILSGMTIGAPPDLLSSRGQNWGLSAFSPRGLRDKGFRAFIELLRHAMRHAGGVRIDHVLGLARLWVVPDGMSAKDGAYISFPLEDLLRLVALESHRNRTVVLGEDLGTIPDGFQQHLAEAGTLGMRVLWFEREFGLFSDPRSWSKAAAGMTSTHDLPTVAGWWTGRDLQWRKQLGLALDPAAQARDESERDGDRDTLWAAFRHSGAADGPAPAADQPSPVVDAAARHLATAACDMLILPIEDVLGLVEQPNLPGTTEGHPNWQRRLPGDAATLLDTPQAAARLQALNGNKPNA